MSSCKLKGDGLPPPPIPDGCRPLSHQVAGHIYGKCKTRAGLLQDSSGSILKLMQTNNRGTREKNFYQVVFAEDQSDPLLLGVRQLVCPFKGTVISVEDPTVEYIKLRDMTQGFVHPCIMDVKIGRIGYTDGDNAKKAEMAKLKYPHMEKLGFQILGMRVFHPQSQKYCYYDKAYGRSLDVTSMIEGLAKFFNVEEKIRTDVMYRFLVRLQQILDWFQVQSSYHFYSSSLLFIYEADLPPGMLKATSPCSRVLSHSPTEPSENGIADEVCELSKNGVMDAVPEPNKNRDTVSQQSKNGIHEQDFHGAKLDTYPLKRKKGETALDNHADSGNRTSNCGGSSSRGVGICSRNDLVDRTEIGAKGDMVETVSTSTSQLCHHHEQKCAGKDMNKERGRHRKAGEGCNGVCYGETSRTATGATRCRDPQENHLSCEQEVQPKHGPHELDDRPRTLQNGPKQRACSHHQTRKNKLPAGEKSKNCLHGCNRGRDSSPPVKGHCSPPHVDIRMIDFAHAIESCTRDENYIFGLKMLMQYIETLYASHVG